MTLFKPNKQTIPAKVLHEKYIVPPFSVFNMHQPYWKERTEFWNRLGLYTTNGRTTGANGLSYDNRRMMKKAADEDRPSRNNGTSTFSPVLKEQRIVNSNKLANICLVGTRLTMAPLDFVSMPKGICFSR